LNTKILVDRAIQFQLDLDAPIQEVWQAWTTEAGITSFFAPACILDFRPGGAYGIFFDPDEEPGKRGGDGMIVLAFSEPHFLSFTWNAPLTLPDVRDHRSHVTIRLEEIVKNKTRLYFREDGFAEGGQWERRIEYFISAWGKVVLPRLAYRLDKGPVDWETYKIEDLSPYQGRVKQI
jgi:uncharacterized protein YndB with AHSA1/START domain